MAASHTIYDTYEKGQENCEECVKEVYPVCHLGHTMCADCILYQVKKGLFMFSGIFYYKKDNTIESIDLHNYDLRGKMCVITDGIFINADSQGVKVFQLIEKNK